MIKFYEDHAAYLRAGDLSPADKVPFKIIEGRYVVCPPQRATSGAETYVPVDGHAAILQIGFNARQSATVSGNAVAWDYSDGHGMTLVAVLRPGKFVLWVPGHHSHGPGKWFLGTVGEELLITLVPLLPKGAKDIELTTQKPVAILSTTVLPVDGLYEVKTLTEDEVKALNITGAPHYIGHPDTKEIVEKLGAVQAQSKLFPGLQPGEQAICFAIAQGKSNRATQGFTSPHQEVALEDLQIRIITRVQD